ncbi:MAG: BACON domain-containing protein [Bacteroidales bacterium]|nr:BACON domain-containing protein [Bacteroidales bacterium]
MRWLQHISLLASVVLASVSCIETESASITFYGLAKDTLTMSSDESYTLLNINSTGRWKVREDADWLDLAPASGNKGDSEIAINVAKNETYSSRWAELTFTTGDFSKVLKVVQKAVPYVLLKESFERSYVPGFGDLPSGWYSLDVVGNSSWGVLNPNSIFDKNWPMYAYSVTNSPIDPETMLISPLFDLPGDGFTLSWKVLSYNGSGAADSTENYDIYLGYIDGDNLLIMETKIYEGQASAEEQSVSVSLDGCETGRQRVIFRHCGKTTGSYLLIRDVLLTNE